MRRVPLDDDRLQFEGALDWDRLEAGSVPRRLPSWTRSQLPGMPMDAVVQMPAGVRVRLATDTTSLELDALLTHIRLMPRALRPAVFDLQVNGVVERQVGTVDGNRVVIRALAPGDITFEPGDPATIRFDGLASGPKLLELWLPQATIVELRELRIDGDAALEYPAPPAAPRWVHHGSSISHCFDASSPTMTWPAVAARLSGVEHLNLGFAGQCLLDPFVARTIRDLPADCISIKAGINVVNTDALSPRTFGPALHGFLDTVREGHPDTPLLVASPIYCAPIETEPGPTTMGPTGRCIRVGGPGTYPDPRLTLEAVRAMVADAVSRRRALGDGNLHFLDGLALFGPDDAADLPDDLHPNAAGYVRIGERFASLAFGPGGAFAS